MPDAYKHKSRSTRSSSKSSQIISVIYTKWPSVTIHLASSHTWGSDPAAPLSSCVEGGARPKGASAPPPKAEDRCWDPSSDASVMGVIRPLLAEGEDPPGGVPAAQRAIFMDHHTQTGAGCHSKVSICLTLVSVSFGNGHHQGTCAGKTLSRRPLRPPISAASQVVRKPRTH